MSAILGQGHVVSLQYSPGWVVCSDRRRHKGRRRVVDVRLSVSGCDEAEKSSGRVSEQADKQACGGRAYSDLLLERLLYCKASRPASKLRKSRRDEATSCSSLRLFSDRLNLTGFMAKSVVLPSESHVQWRTTKGGERESGNMRRRGKIKVGNERAGRRVVGGLPSAAPSTRPCYQG